MSGLKKSTHWRQLRFIGVTFTILLVIISVAHGQNGANKRKEANQLADKVGQLVDLSTKRSVLRFNGRFKG